MRMLVSSGAGLTAGRHRPLPGQAGRRNPAGSCSSQPWIILLPSKVSNPGSTQMPESRQLKLEGNPVRKRFSSLLALVLLAVVAGVCISLGFWQLDRAAQRDALNQQIEHGRTQAPIVLSASTPAESFLPWRAATAPGRWSEEHTGLLPNRQLGRAA